MVVGSSYTCILSVSGYCSARLKMTYSESVEDVAASVQSEFLAWITVDLGPADLHVARSDHFELVVPSRQRVKLVKYVTLLRLWTSCSHTCRAAPSTRALFLSSNTLNLKKINKYAKFYAYSFSFHIRCKFCLE